MTLRGAEWLPEGDTCAHSQHSPIGVAVQDVRYWLDTLSSRARADEISQQLEAIADRLGGGTLLLALVYVAQQERAERKRLERGRG